MTEKIDPSDEVETTFQVGVTDKNCVIHFSKNVRWFALGVPEIDRLISMLRQARSVLQLPPEIRGLAEDNFDKKEGL